jgi:hypothetical protein
MDTHGLFSKVRRLRIIVVFLSLLLAYGAVTYSPQAATPANLYSVSLGGVSGAANNTILAYGRYVLIAPFWPSTGLAENGDLDFSQLDNNSLYVIDTKKPNASPLSKKLSSPDSRAGVPKTVYFPSRILFDPTSSNVYIRGTRFEENDGQLTPIDVIAYVHLALDDTGKPVFDTSVVAIDIEGVSTKYTGEAPLDFSFGENGDLVFTNGASVFSFNLAEGYLNRADIVGADKYGTDDSISLLSVDAATNVVSICENRTFVVPLGKDNLTKTLSKISFYRLGEHGTFDLLKQVSPDQFPDGIALTSGSSIAIVSDSDSEVALFVTTDGSLCSVDLRSDGPATVKRLYTFPELAQSSIARPNPLLIQYDSANRVIGIVKPGFTVQITRPLNGKPGGITRPINLHIASEAPVLAMAALSKKTKVTSAASFTQEFENEGGLSNFVSGQNSQWLISTYSGNLYSVRMTDNLQNSTFQPMGSIGSNVDRIDYYADRTSVVAISSFTLNEDGIRMASPGSLVVGSLSDTQTQSDGAVLQALLPTASVLGRPAPSIRRPCNIKR